MRTEESLLRRALASVLRGRRGGLDIPALLEELQSIGFPSDAKRIGEVLRASPGPAFAPCEAGRWVVLEVPAGPMVTRPAASEAAPEPRVGEGRLPNPEGIALLEAEVARQSLSYDGRERQRVHGAAEALPAGVIAEAIRRIAERRSEPGVVSLGVLVAALGGHRMLRLEDHLQWVPDAERASEAGIRGDGFEMSLEELEELVERLVDDVGRCIEEVDFSQLAGEPDGEDEFASTYAWDEETDERYPPPDNANEDVAFNDEDEEEDLEHAVSDLQDLAERSSEAAAEELGPLFEEEAEQRLRDEEEAAAFERIAETEESYLSSASMFLDDVLPIARRLVEAAFLEWRLAQDRPLRVIQRARELVERMGMPRKAAFLLADGEFLARRLQSPGNADYAVDYSLLLLPFDKAFEAIAEELSRLVNRVLIEAGAPGAASKGDLSDPKRPLLWRTATSLRFLSVVVKRGLEHDAEARDAQTLPERALPPGEVLGRWSQDAWIHRGGVVARDAVISHFGTPARMAWLAETIDFVRETFRNGFVHSDLAGPDAAPSYCDFLLRPDGALPFMMDRDAQSPAPWCIARMSELAASKRFAVKEADVQPILRLRPHAPDDRSGPDLSRLTGGLVGGLGAAYLEMPEGRQSPIGGAASRVPDATSFELLWRMPNITSEEDWTSAGVMAGDSMLVYPVIARQAFVLIRPTPGQTGAGVRRARLKQRGRPAGAEDMTF